MIAWQFFPKSRIIPEHLKNVLSVFEFNEKLISSDIHSYGSNEVLENVRVDLEQLDIISLTNIKAAFDQFRTHPGHRVENSVVGKNASLESINNFFNYSVERLNPAVADTTIVSQTNRNNLLIEKQMPQMYFYPTCRHRYREAYAKFENNKAYFVKIKEIRFERKANNIINDEILYKFVPGDKNNFDRCDFNISTSKWSLT